MRNYRNSFIFAVACNIALIGILGGLWWRSAQHKKTEPATRRGKHRTWSRRKCGLAIERGFRTAQAMGCAATGARTARIHGPRAAGTSSRFSRLRLHHRAERFAESHRAAGDAALFRRRSLNRLDF